MREAAITSAFWIVLGVSFSLVIWALLGGAAAGQYLTGYVIEKSLSVDNVFVWAVILSYFAVPKAYQHRVLFWGVFGALVLRAIFIFAGVALLEAFSWMLYVFGAFLVFTAWRVATHDNERDPPREEPGPQAHAPGDPGQQRVPRPEVLGEDRRPTVRHAAPRRPRARRGHRRGLRGRLDPGDPRGDPIRVHRVHVERVRDPRPAGALLPARRRRRASSATSTSASASSSATSGSRC